MTKFSLVHPDISLTSVFQAMEMCASVCVLYACMCIRTSIRQYLQQTEAVGLVLHTIFVQHLFDHCVGVVRVVQLYTTDTLFVCLLVGCLTSQQQASVSQGRTCLDNCTCCHTEIEVADQTFYLTQSQYTDTGPTSPSADPITPGAWQGSHWSANFEVTGMTWPRKNPGASGIWTRDLPLSRWMPYH